MGFVTIMGANPFSNGFRGGHGRGLLAQKPPSRNPFACVRRLQKQVRYFINEPPPMWFSGRAREGAFGTKAALPQIRTFPRLVTFISLEVHFHVMNGE